MNRGDTGGFNQAHLTQWLETSRHYLFSERERPVGLVTSSGATPSQPATGQSKQDETDSLESDPDPAEKALLQLRLDTHGARVRFISRIRGNMLRRVKRTAQWNSNPLQELEHAFFSHVSFIARNELFRKAAHTFALYRGWMATLTQGTKPVCIHIPAYFG